METYFLILIINFCLAFLIASYGNKKRIGFGWSFFFCIFWNVIVGLIITVFSKNIDEDLPTSPTKIAIGWILVVIGVLPIISGFINYKDDFNEEVIISLQMITIGIGLIGSGLYLINSGKGDKLGKKNFITCKHCKSDIVITNIELSYEEFTCPKCKKVNYLNNDDITYCKYCDLEVELDSNEKKNKKFICPECNKENFINNE